MMGGLRDCPSHKLLEEALGFTEDVNYPKAVYGGGCGSVVLIEDCVETSGAFLLHHLMRRCLTSDRSSDVVVFISFAHPFSHYERILRKMGCNLSGQMENKRFIHHDMLSMKCPGVLHACPPPPMDLGSLIEGDASSDDMLVSLYGKVQKAVALCAVPGGSNHVTIMIDDISLMEVAVHGASNHVLDFLHYCYSLTSQFDCSLVILNHEDIYLNMDQPSPLLHMEHLANVVIKAEPLATGLATDVHGQLTVFNKGIVQGSGKSKSKIRNFQFRVKENKVEFFYPGSQT